MEGPNALNYLEMQKIIFWFWKFFDLSFIMECTFYFRV
jgi:hypothetical protein